MSEEMRNISDTDTAIEISGLTKRFTPRKGLAGFLGHSTLKSPVTAVDRVDLRVDRGELFGLLGPNGAGKTTLIKMLCTLVVPTDGRALVNGFDVEREEQSVRNSIGLVGSEERSFYWRLTGRQNLEFFAALHDLHGEKMHRRIREVLGLMDLDSAADRMFQTYSTGMKQKMCIARGLLTDPAVLFLDEPTRSLDPLAAESVRRFIRDVLVMQQGRTVVLTTHRLEEAAQVCDRIAIMDRGRVRAVGTLSDLRHVLSAPCRYEMEIANVRNGLGERLKEVGGAERLEMLETGVGRKTVRFLSPKAGTAVRDMVRVVVESGAEVLDFRAEEATLEEMFAEFVGDK